MSDSLRRGIGYAAAAAAAVLCILPAATGNRTPEVTCRSGDRLQWALPQIRTEENGMIRVNSADAEELTGLHGVGETIARMILEERKENGPFYYAEDLEAVRGIGPRTLEGFREQIDLTTDESEE